MAPELVPCYGAGNGRIEFVFTHFFQKLPKELEASFAPSVPHFFYFEYFGHWKPLPDSIDFVTQALHGTVYRIHSPTQFSKAVQKFIVQLQPAENYLPSVPRK